MTPSNNCCPTCGSQIAPLQLFVCLQSNVATRLGQTVRLSGQQAVMLHTLLKRQPRVTTNEYFASALWGIGPDAPENETRHIGVQMHRLRRALAPLRVRIENEYGAGYRLVLDELPVMREVA